MIDSDAGIEFRAVSKRYGSAADAPLAVQPISFTVRTGTLTTLLGPSGCGKTTTLRLIAGLESPSAGSIYIAGEDVTHLGPAERNVSMVFQSYALFPHLDVLANVAYGLDVSGVPKLQAKERARAALETVGLTGYDARLPSELSGGQQQRVALARALVLEPAVLLFDEPLSNLDARLRRSMREEIRALQQRLKLTVAYVTHDQAEALAVSDRIIVMNQGRIAQEGTPRELYEQPRDAFVAGFMGEAMLFPAQALADGTVALGPLRVRPVVPVPAGPVTLAVRPEAWILSPPAAQPARPVPGAAPGIEPPGRESVAHCPGLAAEVIKSAYVGHGVELTFRTELGDVFVVSALAPEQARPGTRFALHLAQQGVAVLGG